MVINNISGAANNALASPVDRPNSRTRSNNSPAQSSVPGWNTLAAQVDGTLGEGGLDIADGNAASQSSKLARSGFLAQPATAMLAQANFSPDMVMSLLQE
jgi:flagellin-like hook-associated protein FlgL